MRTIATIFLSFFVFGLAAFGVEFQDNVASGTSHFRTAQVILQAEHAHPADTHLFTLREPNVAFCGFKYSDCAEHVLMVPRKSVREHRTIAEAHREHTARVNAKVALQIGQKFIEEQVVVLTPRSLVSVTFRCDKDCRLLGIERFQAMVAFLLHTAGPAAHAVHAEDELVRLLVVVIVRDINADGASALAPLEFVTARLDAVPILAATTRRHRIVLEAPTVSVFRLLDRLLEFESDVCIQIGKRDRQRIVIGSNHAELITFAFL